MVILKTDTKMFSCPLPAWLHSGKSSSSSVQKQEPAAAEAETSLDSCSLPDRGHTPDVMAEGEDTGVISSLSDTRATSLDGSLSVGRRVVGGGEELMEPQRDTSSDIDEGHATGRPKHR